MYLCNRNCETRLKDSVAQPVEHNTFNVGVLGSSPSWITERESFFNFSLFLNNRVSCCKYLSTTII